MPIWHAMVNVSRSTEFDALWGGWKTKPWDHHKSKSHNLWFIKNGCRRPHVNRTVIRIAFSWELKSHTFLYLKTHDHTNFISNVCGLVFGCVSTAITNFKSTACGHSVKWSSIALSLSWRGLFTKANSGLDCLPFTNNLHPGICKMGLGGRLEDKVLK